MTLSERWRLRVEHETEFTYSSAARASYNEVRKLPLTTQHQTTLDARVQTTPAAGQYLYWDYWGTQVVAFNVDRSHERLSVRSSSVVDTEDPPDRPSCGWSDISAAGARFSEFLTTTRFTHPDASIRAIADELRRPTPNDTLDAIEIWAHEALVYVKGVTSVRTSAVEALHAGRGVCQDFAHVTLALLRATGIPSRYVSGYYHPDPTAEIGTEIVGESHAWVEAWVGDWHGIDPTNGSPIGHQHVLVARGRDYDDVAPVRGIFAGGADHETMVTVRITRSD